MPQRPRIALDATSVTARPTGAGRFAGNLATALPAADSFTDYVALVTPAGADALGGAEGLELVTVDVSHGLVWELGGAGEAARAAGADLLFTTREVVRASGMPLAVHIFEPPTYRLRGGLSNLGSAKQTAKDLYLSAALGPALRRASRVTAGSQATAAWLRKQLRLEAKVILPPLEASFLEHVPDGTPGGDPYFLHLATGDRRENTELVLDGFALLDGTVRLVIAGSAAARLAPALRARDLDGRVDLRGWVSDDELRALYGGALALLHPTRYEGYGGYPALEAMALGTPVVGLRAPGATEALEGAAIVLDRPHPALLAEALGRLAGEPGLRRELAHAGRERVRPLRWEAAAADFADVFAAALRR